MQKFDKKCVDLGAVEGLTGEKKYAVDGRDLEKIQFA